MNNRLLTKNAMDVLASIQEWRIIASGLETDVLGEPDQRHVDWMSTHSRSHPNQEVLFVLSGDTYWGYMGTCYRVKPGDVFMIDRFEEHDDYYPSWVPDIEHLWITLLHDKALVRVVTKKHGKYSEGRATLMPAHTTQHWQRSLFAHTKYPVHMSTVRKLRAYAEVATAISSIIQMGYSEPDSDDESFQEQIIASVEEHIREVGGAGIKVDVLARIGGYSRFHLERLFKKRTGKSLRQFINECKVDSVMQMKASGYSKKEIAMALGFSCPSAFSRWHKQHITQN
jgi:AraC-like DNA-binding protein